MKEGTDVTTKWLGKGFSGAQPRQGICKIQRFGEQLHLHHQGDDI
jgi:hypothetical protein